MRGTYFYINECTEEEVEELKEKLYWADEIEDGIFDEDDFEILKKCEFPEDIPFELIEKYFGDYSFVDEDFWCNTDRDYMRKRW